MNICLVSPEYFPISGGTGAYVYYLSHKLQEFGDEVYVIARDTKSYEKVIDGVQVSYIGCSGSPFLKYWSFARRTSNKLKDLHKNVGLDIVHANLPLVPGFAIPKNLSTSLVSTVHSTWKGEAQTIRKWGGKNLNPNEKWMLRFNSILRNYERKLIDRSDALIAVSKYTKKELVDLYDVAEEKIHVIYNGVDVRRFKPDNDESNLRGQLRMDNETPLILFVGRLYYRKGLTILLKAMALVLSKFKDTRLVISGTGDKRNLVQLQRLAEDLGIEDSVVFLGYFPDDELPRLYATSDIFVLPALYENFPFALLEAFSSGLPVVTTDVGGIPELVSNGVNGLLVKPGQVKALAEALHTLLRKPEYSWKLGAKARNVIKNDFTWNIITDKVVKLYKELIGSSNDS